MLRSDLPSIRLADLPGGADTVVLCHSARLATDLRRAHGSQQAARGKTTWHALQTATPALWLDHLCSGALLRGEIPPESVPSVFLTTLQERGLWEKAIRDDAKHSAWAAELFDINGMAQAGMEAAALMQVWRLDVPAALQTNEFEAFARWRQAVQSDCEKNGWCNETQALAWRTDCISRGVSGLPSRIGLAGFMAADPAMSRLMVALEARGVSLFRLDFGNAEKASAACREQLDAQAECNAAARWAAGLVRETGNNQSSSPARIRIAVADLPARRRMIELALAAALHPDRVGGGWAGHEADYQILGSETLAEQTLVDVALRLLRILVSPRRIAQADFGSLLCSPGWSSDVGEADGRARLEARLRELLPPETSLDRMHRAVSRLHADLGIPQLFQHISHLLETTQQMRSGPKRQLPSVWARSFLALLEMIGWPGERPLIPVEHAAVEGLRESISSLMTLDVLLGRVDAAEALRYLQRHSRDQTLKVRRQTPVRVEVCSLTDAVAAPVDALWVMGLNESAWPPTARPNPLLHWQMSATQVVFSWAAREGEHERRVSPLLADLLEGADRVDARTSAESAATTALGGKGASGEELLERFIDTRAPALTDADHIRGGTRLLQAQAICPAWGFYQFRLGASVLPAPTGSLDGKVRGTLLHGALEAFWRGRSQADLIAMDVPTRTLHVGLAVDHALADYDHRAIDPLPLRLRQLERSRLLALILEWFKLETEREAFLVLACEAHHDLQLEGLPVHVVIDRVDQLSDGRLVIIDYKSGKNVSANSWARPRISEPQLPIYAALAFPDQALAAVALARVTVDKPGFVGVAETTGVLPKLKALDDARKQYPEHEFADWSDLRKRWAERLNVVAKEIVDGCAAVVFDSEAAVAYCDVLPLLRVAERRAQFEEQK
jgi:RecB family exonuclease